MEAKDIIFNEDLEMHVFSKNLHREIRITLSDGLYASEEELTDEYRIRIATFINDLPLWYDKACNAVFGWGKKVCQIGAENQNISLQAIFILFEQNEKELFGLSFRVEFDIEHGCGLQIKGENGNYEIIKAGTADVAFC